MARTASGLERGVFGSAFLFRLCRACATTAPGTRRVLQSLTFSHRNFYDFKSNEKVLFCKEIATACCDRPVPVFQAFRFFNNRNILLKNKPTNNQKRT